MSQPYVILVADDLPTLASYVNKAITQGYDPVGGIGCSKDRDGYRYFQAIIDMVSADTSDTSKREPLIIKNIRQPAVEFTDKPLETGTGKFIYCPICAQSLELSSHNRLPLHAQTIEEELNNINPKVCRASLKTLVTTITLD